MSVITKVNGGSETFYGYENEDSDNEGDIIKCVENRRSYILFPGDNIDFKNIELPEDFKLVLNDETNELLQTNDYTYPNKRTVCCSTVFVKDVIQPNTVMIIDMIWCKKDRLFEYFEEHIQKLL